MAAPPSQDGETRPARLIGPWVVGALGVGGLGLLASRDPNVSGSYGFCPFRAITGWDCPFCGGLRGTYSLLHGDVAGALDHNVMLPLMWAGLLAVGVLWWRGTPITWRGGGARQRAVGITVVVGALIAFWVARNVPAWSYLDAA